jgi:hypothetical protein
MSRARDRQPVSFLGRHLPAQFAVRQVTIPAGCQRAFVPHEWAGALVIVESGEIELECTAGSRASFPAGSVMFFDSLPLRTLRNRSRQPAVLTSLTRTRATATDTDPIPTSG